LRDYISSYAAAAHMSFASAQPIAMGSVYRQMLLQSSMLAYKNAFAVLALTALLLSPLVWIMRLPPKRVMVKVDEEQMVAH
jgi:DHA2 family multidrug resistance protein